MSLFTIWICCGSIDRVLSFVICSKIERSEVVLRKYSSQKAKQLHNPMYKLQNRRINTYLHLKLRIIGLRMPKWHKKRIKQSLLTDLLKIPFDRRHLYQSFMNLHSFVVWHAWATCESSVLSVYHISLASFHFFIRFKLDYLFILCLHRFWLGKKVTVKRSAYWNVIKREFVLVEVITFANQIAAKHLKLNFSSIVSFFVRLVYCIERRHMEL